VKLQQIDRIGSELLADQISVLENVIWRKNVVVFVTGLSWPAIIFRRNFRRRIKPLALVLGNRLSEKVSEHYGIEVSVSTVRLIAEGHGAVLEEESGVEAHLPAKGVPCLIAEFDGSLVPCVEIGEDAGDRRKRRILC
jgi:hypothetical protein